MADYFSSLNFYFLLASLVIVIPIIYGFVSDYKRDHKFFISFLIVSIIIVLLYFISDYVLELISIFQ